MSGLIGHTMYGVLAEQAVRSRGLPAAPIIARHRASFLCGAYLGCDIQVMPEAICLNTGREVGFGTVPLERSPITGGEVKPWSLRHEGRSYRPRELHEMFYGRSHLVFGWKGDDVALRVPWDHLADYGSRAIRDGLASERGTAYALGWLVHVVGDSLIKSVQPGLRMHLLDGVYTPRNRIVQDQFTFHRVGIELELDWPALFRDMAATPVEPCQLHYMRIGERGGHLGAMFDDGWQPEHAPLLSAVLAENRRYLPHHAADVLRLVALRDGEASEAARRASGGLGHEQMLAMAEAAGMRRTLATIADQCADLIEQITAQVPEWSKLPRTPDDEWATLKQQWKAA